MGGWDYWRYRNQPLGFLDAVVELMKLEEKANKKAERKWHAQNSKQ